MICFKHFKELSQQQIEAVNAIFFETSAIKEFKSEEAKEHFHYKYLGFYQQHSPSNFFALFQDELLMGYICGVLDSSDQSELFELHPYYNLFADLYDQYPAHLHINFSLQATGQGLGSLLIQHFEEHLKKQKVSGVHLITSPQARNVHFYQKNGYDFLVERNFKESSLLLMGKSLTA